jgi:hypothetical protein
MATEIIMKARKIEQMVVRSRPRVCGLKWFGNTTGGGGCKGLLKRAEEFMAKKMFTRRPAEKSEAVWRG